MQNCTGQISPPMKGAEQQSVRLFPNYLNPGRIKTEAVLQVNSLSGLDCLEYWIFWSKPSEDPEQTFLAAFHLSAFDEKEKSTCKTCRVFK